MTPGRERRRLSRTASTALHLLMLLGGAVLATLIGESLSASSALKALNVESAKNLMQGRPLPLHPSLRIVEYDAGLTSQEVRWLIEKFDGDGAKVVFFDVPTGDDQVGDALAEVQSTTFIVGLPKSPGMASKQGGYRHAPGAIDADRIGRALWKGRLALPNVRVGSAITDDPGGVVSSCQLIVHDTAKDRSLLHAAFLCALHFLVDDPDQTRTNPEGTEVWVSKKGWQTMEQLRMLLHGIEGDTPPAETRSQRVDGDGCAVPRASAKSVLVTDARGAYRDTIVILGERREEVETIIGPRSPTSVMASMVNTILQSANAESTGTVSRPWITFLVALVATFSALGRLPTTRRKTKPLGGLIVTLAGFAAAGFLAWYLPVFLFDNYGWFVPPVALYVAALVGAMVGMLLVTRFAEAYRGSDLPNRFDGPATVVFVDMKSSTQLVERVGAESAPLLVGRFIEIATRDIRSLGGRVERTLGDGVLAIFFGPPVGHPDHAARAARAAASIVRDTRSLFESILAEWGIESGVAIGIETGPVSIDHMRTGEGWEWQSFGPTVHLAKRLQESCRELANPVVLGPACAAALPDSSEAISLGTIEAKGFIAPVAVYGLGTDT